MSVQLIIVLSIIAVAVIFAARTIIKKRHAFSTKQNCDKDCGCE